MGKFVANPTFTEQEGSDLDLRWQARVTPFLMVECGAKEVSEGKMVEALEFGHQAIQPLIDLQEQMAAEVGKPKRAYTSFVA